jgi:UDP-N-acetylmuramoylalanine--D-glutamate ligase
VAALRSFDEPIVLLLGGREKHLPLEELLEEAGRRCRGVLTFGEAGEMLAAAVAKAGINVQQLYTLDDAVQIASIRSRSGDIVLLSPACTSFDAYDNFEQRGIEFRRLVKELAQA